MVFNGERRTNERIRKCGSIRYCCGNYRGLGSACGVADSDSRSKLCTLLRTQGPDKIESILFGLDSGTSGRIPVVLPIRGLY